METTHRLSTDDAEVTNGLPVALSCKTETAVQEGSGITPQSCRPQLTIRLPLRAGIQQLYFSDPTKLFCPQSSPSRTAHSLPYIQKPPKLLCNHLASNMSFNVSFSIPPFPSSSLLVSFSIPPNVLCFFNFSLEPLILALSQ